jgi:hypothetical protein
MTEPELNTRLQTITPPDEAARATALEVVVLPMPISPVANS